MIPPGFWAEDGLLPRLLSPLGCLTAAITARRVARPGWRAPVPVICVGNASVGGTGKTTVALDLAARLGGKIAFLTRGHGGAGRGRVDIGAPGRFGDEALLLARAAPTYADPDRARAARQAIADGAELLILDDGLQNPGLAKDVSLLVIDGQVGFGNGRCLPAGPLREPAAAAAARCRAAVLIGPDRTGALARVPALPVLRARLVAQNPPTGARVLAFAGIGRPTKFAETLTEAGVEVAHLHAFADHHRYSERDLAGLRADAKRRNALLVTTPKDAVKLPPGFAAVVGVRLVWEDEAALAAAIRIP
jgi:tetraacyldisaccharide 4'-kinase